MFISFLLVLPKNGTLGYYTTTGAKMQRTKPIKVLLKCSKKMEKYKLVCLLMKIGMIEYIHIRISK